MNSNPWFRMYHEFATDPKVQMLSEADQRRFVMLLCMRCCNGDVTLQDDAIAFQLRVTDEEWAATKTRLVAKGLIDENAKPLAWDKRQYASDSSKIRVARHRERKRNEHVTQVKRYSNALDTDTEADTEAEVSSRAREREEAGGRAPIELSGLNDPTSAIVAGMARIQNQLAPDYRWAKTCLDSNIGLYGADAVRDGWAEFQADQADGKLRNPSVKALVSYFQTAKNKTARGTPVSTPNRQDFGAQRVERGKAFLAKLKTSEAQV